MDKPQIGELPYKNRKRFFFILVIIFLFALPALIFYTTGYRINFDDTENRIMTTGGLYITTDNLDVDVYLDDDQVRRPRLFRSAYYIQDVETGMHRAVVQQDRLHTWVKDLPVDPYIVIEAAAFNMPLRPQIRHIPELIVETGQIIIPVSASSSAFFSEATTSQDILFATSTPTTTTEVNTEYTFVESLFSTSTASSTSLMDRFLEGVERFGFATSTDRTATSTIEQPVKGDVALIERKGELYAKWIGADTAIPYYFCVTNTATSSIAERYGEHVVEQIVDQSQSTTTPIYQDSNRICRWEIKIDRKRQDVIFYDFLPGSSDLVLLQLEEGLYVSEIDDRAWQNTQQIFAGEDFSVLVQNETIYLKQGDLYAELLTKIPEE